MVRDGTWFAGALFTLLLLLQGCVFGTRLRTESALPRPTEGTVDLYLYGCRNPVDIENVAVLVSTSAKHPVELFVSSTSYKVKRGVPVREALAEAERFVRCSVRRVGETAVRKVLDESGGIIAYDVRPLYFPFETDLPDVMLIDYSLKEGKVTTYIRLDPFVERRSVLRDIHSSPGN